ncbi:flagellin modification protein A, partial [Pseudomonas aeruginosa]
MLNGKRVLISGAGGLLGTRLVERLLSENSIVIAADLDVELLRERLKAIGISEHSSLSLEKLDLNDSEEVMFFFNALPCLGGR